MAHFNGVKKDGSDKHASWRGELAERLKHVRRGTVINTAVLLLAAEFKQSTNILLDRELRKTRKGMALLGFSTASGFMIGSSITTIGSQLYSAYASKPIDLIYGDLIFAAGIAIQTSIHFVRKKLKQNA